MNGLYLAPPHGKLIYVGKKTAIAKDRPYPDLVGEFVLVSDGVDGRAYGTLVNEQEGPFGAEEFKARFDDHRVTDKEQARWWPDGDVFYLYTIKSFVPFATPLPVEVPAGVQTLMGEVQFKEDDMPWKVFKEDGEFCVYKVDPEGEKTGKSLGCHPSESAARAQQAALYASESKNDANIIETKVPFIPFGVTSFEEMDAIEAERERQLETAKRTAQLHQIIDNITADPAVIDKSAALSHVSQEYVTRIGAKARGDGQGVGGPRQGDGGADVCTCPECGATAPHEKGTPCNQVKCPKCGAAMTGATKEAGDKAAWTTATVNNLPDSSFLYIEPGGKKDKEGKTAPRSLRHLPVKDASGKVDLPHLRNAISRLGQSGTGSGWLTEALRKRLLSKARGMLESANKAGRRLNSTMISILDKIKEGLDGLYKWVTYGDEDKSFGLKVIGDVFITFTTNSFIDREGEIFSAEAIQNYVERNKSGIKALGEVWYRHLPGSKFAHTIFQGVQGRFLVEVHKFDDTPIGQAMKALLNDYPSGHPEVSPEGWGCSHGFFYDPIDREDKIYEWFDKRETSVLPASVASNPYTKLEVIPMDEKAVQEFEQLVGEDLASSVLTGLDELTKELEAAGIARKEQEEPEPEVTEPEVAEGGPEVAESEIEAAEAPEAEVSEPEVAEVDKAAEEKILSVVKEAIDLDGLVTGWKALQAENEELKAQLAEAQGRIDAIEANKEAEQPRFPWSSYVPSQGEDNVAEKGDKVLNTIPPEVPSSISALTSRM